jgi:carbohydrate-binding DOMON domain-containing protein
VTDPTGDDNGPGVFQYPTSPDYHAGAFDITRFQVLSTGSTESFILTTRSLDPTFGNPLGAQLVDVYVHDPSATVTSTQASFPQRNYTIAPSDAWSRLIEVQGFGQRYVDATGATVGIVSISADDAQHTISFSVPTATLGQIGPGWAFTVVLTGQDGFSPDQARAFAPTPQGFLFGVCAPGGTSPICSFDPNKVPKVMDTLTPPGISQAIELDPTLGPVVLAGIVLPRDGVTPEPSTWALMLVGFAGLGYVGYRQSRKSGTVVRVIASRGR